MQLTGIACALLFLLHSGLVSAQNLEPRRWTHLPVGLNMFGVGFIQTDSDIFFVPVLELANVTRESETILVTYLHVFNLLGKTARIDLLAPYIEARWKGLLSGEPASTERKGLGDPRLRFSVNLLGSPALKGKQFRAYRVAHPKNTILGVALSMTPPLGEYQQDKLLNLGKNRFVFQPQLGVVHNRNKWSYELTGSVFLFTDNDEFFGDSKREQKPLYALQTHLVYNPTQRWWVSLGAAYEFGGRSTIDGDEKDDRREDVLFGISSGLAISNWSSVKLGYIGSRTQQDVGRDSDIYVLACTIQF